MPLKITKLEAPAGMFMNDIETSGRDFNPNAGYLLHLMIEAGELDNDRDVKRPIVTFVTEEFRVFSFMLHGSPCVFKVEITE